MLEEGRFDDVVLALARDYFLKLSRGHGDNAIYFYELGASMPTGRQSCFARGAKKAAGRTLNEGIASVQQSLKVNENPADAPGAPVSKQCIREADRLREGTERKNDAVIRVAEELSRSAEVCPVVAPSIARHRPSPYRSRTISGRRQDFIASPLLLDRRCA